MGLGGGKVGTRSRICPKGKLHGRDYYDISPLYVKLERNCIN